MKKLLLVLFLLPVISYGQYNVAYTVTVTKLMALADDCDGGAPFCINAPQDPIFNIWSSDGEANENTNCWIFEDDSEIEYGLWKDIQNLEIANESGVNTDYITFDMSGFETDALGSAGCSSGLTDDAVYDRQFVGQFNLLAIPSETTYVDTINLGGVYYAEIEIYWEDLNAGLFDLGNDIQFKIAPNPTEGAFNVSLSEGTINDFDVVVTDLAGRTVYQSSVSSNETQVDLSNQEAGAYFVRITTGDKSATKTLLLK